MPPHDHRDRHRVEAAAHDAHPVAVVLRHRLDVVELERVLLERDEIDGGEDVGAGRVVGRMRPRQRDPVAAGREVPVAVGLVLDVGDLEPERGRRATEEAVDGPVAAPRARSASPPRRATRSSQGVYRAGLAQCGLEPGAPRR